jgi:hypothetical protein
VCWFLYRKAINYYLRPVRDASDAPLLSGTSPSGGSDPLEREREREKEKEWSWWYPNTPMPMLRHDISV